ncbi:hypothetical protein [Enterobacillus tribolii]|nr:hypothetical protein [Enterobacillus tribolii]
MKIIPLLLAFILIGCAGTGIHAGGGAGSSGIGIGVGVGSGISF